MAVDQLAEKPTTISTFRAVFAVVPKVCLAGPFVGNPWIQLYNGDLELYLFYYLKT